jgi:phage terminase large subunit GpA-like protein
VTDLIQEEINKNQFRFFKRKIKKRPITGVIPSFVSWAEAFRYLPVGDTEFAGKFSSKVTPHLIEPLEMCHPSCDKTHVTIMKSVQAAVTTAVGENALGAWIYYKIGTCGMFTATQDLAETRSKTTIATMIKRAGLVFEAISDGGTGETTLHKQFAGNINLYLAGYLSIGKMKSNPMKFIFKDEMDEMPAELKGQGDVNKVIEGRTQGKRKFKILNVSTPSDMRTSRIYKEYLMGDQRKLHVPCPLCLEKQELELKGSGKKYGLTFTMKENEQGEKTLISNSVRYICKHCGGEFKESKKQWMLANGDWIPTATPKDKNRVSYHISGLMSPEFALSWEKVCQEFINCDFGKDILMFKDFTINMLGMPWATTVKTPQWQELMDRAEDYCIEEVPTGEKRNYGGFLMPHQPLILYAGCDVQGDRLELHVVGFGADKEKWALIDYKVFHSSDVGNIDDPCWNALEDYVYNHTYDICGIECNISRCGIDSGYDPREAKKRNKDFNSKASIVYDFVYPRTDRFTAIMGVSTEKAMGIIKEAKINDVRTPLTKRYNIHVSIVKEMIMNVIEQTEGTGTIHFPRYQMFGNSKKTIIADKYKRFLSERYQETKPGVYGWVKIHERNEDLDTFIYAVAMAEYEGVNSWSYEYWNTYYEDLIG